MAVSDACGVRDAPGIVLYKGCPKDNFGFRHGGCVNLAFLDGHAAPVREKRIPFGMAHRYGDFWSARLPVPVR
jgi:prepilin-type processing-associated H-X9-DG protein